MAAPTKKTQAWKLFDMIVSDAEGRPAYAAGPWRGDVYEPDFKVLERLLGVPLYLNANSQSGVPALALDVWTSYELRRAGFDADAVWPRPRHPRVLPSPIVQLMKKYTGTQAQKDHLRKHVEQLTPIAGVASSSANILGKHYVKQVDVVMSAWDTGPELLISTKRMDSSFGKNAANRIEESYGDAKNLRSRHPMAALGFLYALRSTILATEPAKATWLIDLLTKMGREDDAYDAVCLLMIDYEGDPPEGSDGGHEDEDDATAPPTSTSEPTPANPEVDLDTLDIEVPAQAPPATTLPALPRVRVLHEEVPDELQASRFFKVISEHVMSSTPVNMHQAARKLRRWPTA